MRKFILPILALSMSLTQAKAQKFYAKAGLGYGFTTNGQTTLPDGHPYPLNGTVISGPNIQQSFNYKSASFGAGMYGTLGLGMHISKHIGVEMNGQFGVVMKKFNATSKVEYNQVIDQKGNTFYAKMPVLINPELVLQTGNELNIYTRMGVLLPVSTTIINEVSNTYSNHDITAVQEIRNKFSMGFSAGAGISYNLSRNINVWAEVKLNALSVYVKEMEITEYNVNGVSVLDTFTPEQKKSEHDNEGSGTDVCPTFSLPFSSIGIMAGVSFEF